MSNTYRFERFGIIFLLGLIFVLFLLIIIWFSNFNDRLNPIECSLGLKECVTAPVILSQPNPLEYYEEECINETIIEKYELVKPPSIKEFCIKEKCLEEIDCYDLCELKIYENERCINNCIEEYKDSYSNKPYVRFYNETRCKKWIFVKNG